MAPQIEVQRLRKTFGSHPAVDDITFSVEKGEVLGFLGPNGAGKTTTMRMITGFIAPTSGSIAVCGIDVLKDPIRARERMGYLPEGAPLYPEMTPATFLGFIAEVRGLSGREGARRLAEVGDRFHLEEVWNQPMDTLSKGFKRRVALAQAILHDPEVLILDEPTDGLDPNQKFEVRQQVKAMARDKAIIISTHILEEVDAVCSRALIIGRGRILADGTPRELEAMSPYFGAVSLLVSAGQAPGLAERLERLPGVAKVDAQREEGERTRLTVFPGGGAPILEKVNTLLREGGHDIHEFRHERGRLDEVFRSLTVPPETLEGGEGE